MYGQIGKHPPGIHRHRPDFYYDNRAAILARRRLLGNGTFDCDFHRERAPTMRVAAMRDFFRQTIRRLVLSAKALIAAAIVAAAILLSPADSDGCRVCGDGSGFTASTMEPADRPTGLY